ARSATQIAFSFSLRTTSSSLVLRSALFPFRFLTTRIRSPRRGVRHAYNGRRSRAGLGSSGQPALRQQLHGALDRDTDHTGLLIPPAVAVQRPFFLHAEIIDLQ